MIICSWKKFRDKKLTPLIKDLIQEKYDDAAKEFTQYLVNNYVSLKEHINLENRLNVIDDVLKAVCKEVKASRNDTVPADFDRLVKLQSERCKIYQMDFEDDTEYERKINAMKKVFEKPALQSTLDAFDFEGAADNANKLGFTTGFDERKIEAKELIKDAIEMFTGLEEEIEDGKCGRRQLGRLVATKLWSEDEQEPWYMLNYFIEMTEN